MAVEAITETGRWETVYNFRIAEYHTYFVGDNDWGFAVWAHNANYITSRIAKNAGSGYQKFVNGTKKAVEHLYEFTDSAGKTVKAWVDGITRWRVVEAKFSSRIYSKSFWSSLKVGSARHDELVGQMRRLLALSADLGKQGVLLVTSTHKAKAQFKYLLSVRPDLDAAIKNDTLRIVKKSWW